MKTFRLIAVNFVFAAIFAVSAFAQAQTTTGRVGLVNTYAFEDGKAGIAKLVAASGALEKEFQPRTTELQTLYNKIQSSQKELTTTQENAASGKVPIDQKAVQAKADEYERMGRDFKFKQDSLKADIDKRRQAVVGPVWGDIMKAMQEFAKQKGYAVILDGAKLEEAGILMAFDDKFDVTKEFITFYNGRPAGTATTAAPK